MYARKEMSKMSNKQESTPEDKLDYKRTKSPADALMTEVCFDAYSSLTMPQKMIFRVKQVFRPRDNYVEKV
jgi:hypothetical protein